MTMQQCFLFHRDIRGVGSSAEVTFLTLLCWDQMMEVGILFVYSVNLG